MTTPHTTDTDAEEFLTTPELARRTGIKARTWEGRRRRGPPDTPNYIKLGTGKSARVLYRWSDVQAWLAGQVRQSTTE